MILMEINFLDELLVAQRDMLVPVDDLLGNLDINVDQVFDAKDEEL